MTLGPWVGCVLPGAHDFVEVAEVDLDRLDVHGLLALARTIGIVPMTVDQKPLKAEVIREAIRQHAIFA